TSTGTAAASSTAVSADGAAVSALPQAASAADSSNTAERRVARGSNMMVSSCFASGWQGQPALPLYHSSVVVKYNSKKVLFNGITGKFRCHGKSPVKADRSRSRWFFVRKSLEPEPGVSEQRKKPGDARLLQSRVIASGGCSGGKALALV